MLTSYNNKSLIEILIILPLLILSLLFILLNVLDSVYQFSFGILLILLSTILFFINKNSFTKLLFLSIIFVPNINRLLYSKTLEINQLNLLSISIDYMLVLLAIGLLLSHLTHKKNIFSTKIDKIILLYCLWIIVEFAISYYNFGIYEASKGLRMLLLPIAIYYAIVYENIKVDSLIKIILSAYIIVILYEIWQQVFGFFPWEKAYINNYREGAVGTLYFKSYRAGVEGFFKNLNGYDLTYVIGMFAPIIFIKWKNPKKISKEEICFFILGMALLIIILERTPLIAGIMGILIYYFILGYREGKKSKILSAIIIIIILYSALYISKDFLLFSSSLKLRRLGEMVDPFHGTTLEYRALTHWASALPYILRPQILIGYGLSFNTEQSTPFFRGLHSLYINQIIEMGIIGLFLLLYILYLIFRISYRSENKMLIIYFTAIIVFLIIGIPSAPFVSSSKYYFWFFIGLIVKENNQMRLKK